LIDGELAARFLWESGRLLWGLLICLGFVVLLFEVLVALGDLSGGLGLEGFEEGKKLLGIEGVEVVVGADGGDAAWGVDDDYGDFGVDLFEFSDEVVAGHVGEASVGDDAVEGGVFAEGFDGLVAGVGGEDVEFGGFDDQLAGRNGRGAFAIDDEEAGANHDSIVGRAGGKVQGRVGGVVFWCGIAVGS